jgi:hypothetical protein
MVEKYFFGNQVIHSKTLLLFHTNIQKKGEGW